MNDFFSFALTCAYAASTCDEVPVGAVIVQDGKILAQTSNQMRHLCDATAHAEILAIQKACHVLKTQHLVDCDMYVTLEPCPMCAGAIAQSRIRRLFFGAYDPKGGGVDHGPRVFDTSLHRPDVIGGIQERECAELLTCFFKQKRDAARL